MPFDSTDLSSDFMKSEILILTNYSEKSNFFIGLYDNNICICEKSEKKYIAQSSDVIINDFDFSHFKNKKSVVQVLKNV